MGELDCTDDLLNPNGLWDPGEGEQWTTTIDTGIYTMTLEIEDLDPGTYHVREQLQPGWIQSFDGGVEITVNPDGSFDLEFPDGTPLDPTDSGPLGSAGPYNFGNYQTPGVRTPGFWTNPNWQQFWNGDPDDQDSLPQNGTDKFPDGEITYAVTDPVTGLDYPREVPVTTIVRVKGQPVETTIMVTMSGLLIGDYNLNGLTDSGEDTVFYRFDEALAILNASTQTINQDARYLLDRDVVATWLNFLNGNPIEDGTDHDQTDAPEVGSPQYYLDQAINWLQNVTPDENADGKRDGYLNGLPTTGPRARPCRPDRLSGARPCSPTTSRPAISTRRWTSTTISAPSTACSTPGIAMP